MVEIFLVRPLVLLALAVSSTGPSEGASLPILDRAIEHHGGALYDRSETHLVITSKSGSFRLRVRQLGGLYDHEVVRTLGNGTEERSRVTNEKVERWRGEERVPLDSAEAERVRAFVQARVFFPFLPHGLDGPDVSLREEGLERWGKRELRRVKVTFAPGSSASADDEYLFWFDPESARLEQYAYSFNTGTDEAGLRLRLPFNYRRVGGILFFDAENLGTEGDPSLTVDRIRPDFAASMEPVSTIRLRDLRVEILGRPSR